MNTEPFRPRHPGESMSLYRKRRIAFDKKAEAQAGIKAVPVPSHFVEMEPMSREEIQEHKDKSFVTGWINGDFWKWRKPL